MNLIDKRKEFCPSGCGTKFHKKGVLGYGILPHDLPDYGTFEYECPKCGMSYEMEIYELLELGFEIEDS